MSHFLDFIDGSAINCVSVAGEIENDLDAAVGPPSNAPFLWSAEGTLDRRLPATVTSDQAALDALRCPYESQQHNLGTCTGETTASGDLSHLIFSSATMSFTEPGQPAGLTIAPGSAYDEDLATGQISVISKLPAALGGGNIPQDPSFANEPPQAGSASEKTFTGGSEEFLRFPAVSQDGSHILISTASEGVEADCRRVTMCERFVETPLHLYMRVQHGEVGETYEVAESSVTHEPAPVTFIGMTPDGAKVFFTSEAHLTGEDLQHGGASLYEWSLATAEAGQDPLTLISKGPSESPGSPGNTKSCQPVIAPFRGNNITEGHGFIRNVPLRKAGGEVPWTASCGIQPYSGYDYSGIVAGLGGSGYEGSSGGNGYTPAAISASGDIYFFSPERLDGSHGVPGRENLFLYRNGHLTFVTTLNPERRCGPHLESDQNRCSQGPIVRLQVTPDDSHMAFITASRITPYDNAGHLEMYTYTPATGDIHCASCNPSGQPATTDVFGSENGLFLTDDGRVFFSTDESLVPRDTDEGQDVYEYSDGRPQLISAGTGTTHLSTVSIFGEAHAETSPGLLGVSADGTDVYFSTFDILLSEDHNGSFLKFYDARTNGGFPQPAPTQPCAAAEECHGPGTEPPVFPTQGTSANLSGGNFKQVKHRQKKHHQKKHHKPAKGKVRHHRANANRGGGK
jgi:hypothetical protein